MATNTKNIFLTRSLKSFLTAGNQQSVNFLQPRDFTTNRPTSLREKGSTVTSANAGFLSSVGPSGNNRVGQFEGLSSGASVDRLAQVFEDRRKSIKQRIALPGASIFLSGR